MTETQATIGQLGWPKGLSSEWLTASLFARAARAGLREAARLILIQVFERTEFPAFATRDDRLALKGQRLVPHDEAFAIERSIPHGHVKAILGTIRRLGLDTIIASRRSRERNLVVAMIAERLLHGCSKPASTRLWHTTTLAEELSVQDADVG